MLLGRAFVVLLLLAGIAMGSYATLGDGTGKKASPKLLTGKTMTKPGSFSLRSGYNFRGNQVIDFNNDNSRYINLGDWIRYFTYAEFDGEELTLKSYSANDHKIIRNK